LIRRVAAVLGFFALLAGCRTTRPAGEETPVAPLTSTSADDASRQLAARRAQLTSERVLLHIRATNGDHVQSFNSTLAHAIFHLSLLSDRVITLPSSLPT